LLAKRHKKVCPGEFECQSLLITSRSVLTIAWVARSWLGGIELKKPVLERFLTTKHQVQTKSEQAGLKANTLAIPNWLDL
jgi:hypothetical protein